MPAPKRVIVPKLKGSVKIDGELDEPVWAKAALLEPFYQNDGSGPEREHTQVKIWYDDKALYLGWTCRDIDIQATMTARDSRFWEEEVVEFFVMPQKLGHYFESVWNPIDRLAAGTRYFEFEWNPLGGVFDAVIDNTLDEKSVSKSFKGDWSFTAKQMRNAVKVKGTVNNSTDKDLSSSFAGPLAGKWSALPTSMRRSPGSRSARTRSPRRRTAHLALLMPTP